MRFQTKTDECGRGLSESKKKNKQLRMRTDSFFSSKEENKGITVCEIQHFCLTGFFLWKISAGLD